MALVRGVGCSQAMASELDFDKARVVQVARLAFNLKWHCSASDPSSERTSWTGAEWRVRRQTKGQVASNQRHPSMRPACQPAGVFCSAPASNRKTALACRPTIKQRPIQWTRFLLPADWQACQKPGSRPNWHPARVVAFLFPRLLVCVCVCACLRPNCQLNLSHAYRLLKQLSREEDTSDIVTPCRGRQQKQTEASKDERDSLKGQ